MTDPQHIDRWPARPNEVNSKVPTLLNYPDTDHAPQWGFPCRFLDGRKELFKPYLDPNYLERLGVFEPDSDLPTISDARKWYRDFMQCLYHYICQYISDQFGDISRLRVEFLFSLPTTFRTQNITTTLRALLMEAGFGQSIYHTIEFGLTEPQAAAIDVPTIWSFRSGEIMLIVDAGGGTTDFTLVEHQGPAELQELVTIPGIDVGSTHM